MAFKLVLCINIESKGSLVSRLRKYQMQLYTPHYRGSPNLNIFGYAKKLWWLTVNVITFWRWRRLHSCKPSRRN